MGSWEPYFAAAQKWWWLESTKCRAYPPRLQQRKPFAISWRHLYTFVSDLLDIDFVRGAPVQVGACWNERRTFGGGEIVVRKTITKISSNPFEVSEVMEATENAGCTVPNFVATYTISIASASPLEEGATTNDNRKIRNCCTVLWHAAFLSAGMCGRVLSALCHPCLKRSMIASFQEEMRCYYEESLRRTIEAEKACKTEPSEWGDKISMYAIIVWYFLGSGARLNRDASAALYVYFCENNNKVGPYKLIWNTGEDKMLG